MCTHDSLGGPGWAPWWASWCTLSIPWWWPLTSSRNSHLNISSGFINPGSGSLDGIRRGVRSFRIIVSFSFLIYLRLLPSHTLVARVYMPADAGNNHKLRGDGLQPSLSAASARVVPSPSSRCEATRRSSLSNGRVELFRRAPGLERPATPRHAAPAPFHLRPQRPDQSQDSAPLHRPPQRGWG